MSWVSCLNTGSVQRRPKPRFAVTGLSPVTGCVPIPTDTSGTKGRADDLMNAFGYRVAPEEVERVLAAHGSVHEVAVTETEVRPDVSLITAFVVPRDPTAFDADDLGAYASRHLADYKRPKVYKVLEQLPRTPSGKVRRKDLGRVDVKNP